ncbi:hypothetical protein [Kribbella sp. C-35]|uniref:hypothetical protein n=1 Tax=Kribbella sp. C-35 TaxID=2789276 RepID=UPI003979DCF2
MLEEAAVSDPLDGYLAVRRLVAKLQMPDRCFVRLASRRKPIFVDLTNPMSVSALGSVSYPMTLEWAKDGSSGELYLFGARLGAVPEVMIQARGRSDLEPQYG